LQLQLELDGFKTRKNWTESEVGTFIWNGMVCIEMLIFSIMHLIAFPSDLYTIRAMSQAPLIRDVELEDGGYARAISDVTKQTDIMKDTFNTFVPKIIRNLNKPRQPKEKNLDSAHGIDHRRQARKEEQTNIMYHDEVAFQDAVFKEEDRELERQARQREEDVEPERFHMEFPDDLPNAKESKR